MKCLILVDFTCTNQTCTNIYTLTAKDTRQLKQKLKQHILPRHNNCNITCYNLRDISSKTKDFMNIQGIPVLFEVSTATEKQKLD